MTTVAIDCRIISTTQLAEIMRIENASYPEPWSADEMRQLLAAPGYFGTGAFEGSRLIGYAVWATVNGKLILHNIAVDPERRRLGAGRAIIEFLKAKVLQTKSRKRIELIVSELNLGVLVFFRATGFKWIKTIPNHFHDKRDAYLMQWRRPLDS